MTTATESRVRGLHLKRVNALTAVLCGGLPAAVIGLLNPPEPGTWLIGIAVGLLWANAFEYVYHRFLLHLPGNFLARRHLVHHATVGTATEAEHVNLGGSPLWVALLFVFNSVPVVVVDLVAGFGVAPGVLLGFTIYFLAVEEVHWRIHVGGRLPVGLRFARQHHLAHHTRPDARFNIFLPLFDYIFRS
jgi:hypothetical protein